MLGYWDQVYVPKYRLSPAEVIELIRAAGGIPVLAHPVFAPIDELLPELVEQGLRAIEIYHSKHDAFASAHFERLAKKHNLLITGGTDSHGFDVPVGMVHVPYELVERLKGELRA